MTDEKIKEEFARGMGLEYPMKDERFKGFGGPFFVSMWKNAARISKIEVLEELINRCNETGIADRLVTSKMIEELKAGK